MAAPVRQMRAGSCQGMTHVLETGAGARMCKNVMDKFKAVIQKDWLKCFKFGYNIPWAWKDIPGMMHVNE